MAATLKTADPPLAMRTKMSPLCAQDFRGSSAGRSLTWVLFSAHANRCSACPSPEDVRNTEVARGVISAIQREHVAGYDAAGGSVETAAITNESLGRMVQALVSKSSSGVAFAVARAHLSHDCGAIRVTRVDTGRWLCLMPEGVIQTEMQLVLSEGCAAVLTPSSTVSDIGRSLEALGETGSVFVPGNLVQVLAAAVMAGQNGQRPDSRHSSTVQVPRLTRREREVLGLVAAGQSNTEIAQTLTISMHTVRSHIRSLAEKLKARSRTKIVANARALGLDERLDRSPRTSESGLDPAMRGVRES